jgi:hypothetical protein
MDDVTQSGETGNGLEGMQVVPGRAALPARGKRLLKSGERVILHYDDGFEEERRVMYPPRMISLPSGRKWVVWLQGTHGWFALWRVRPLEAN